MCRSPVAHSSQESPAVEKSSPPPPPHKIKFCSTAQLTMCAETVGTNQQPRTRRFLLVSLWLELAAVGIDDCFVETPSSKGVRYTGDEFQATDEVRYIQQRSLPGEHSYYNSLPQPAIRVQDTTSTTNMGMVVWIS